ncbi:hypothetical protein NBRC116601_16250 [Cognatishimia sp. WU-CL00825]
MILIGSKSIVEIVVYTCDCSFCHDTYCSYPENNLIPKWGQSAAGIARFDEIAWEKLGQSAPVALQMSCFKAYILIAEINRP